jgi:hypothetical protein
MTEPFYIAQTGERSHLDDPQAWFRKRAIEAREEGGKWLRATIGDGLLLFECWKNRPKDEGDPRWIMGENE